MTKHLFSGPSAPLIIPNKHNQRVNHPPQEHPSAPTSACSLYSFSKVRTSFRLTPSGKGPLLVSMEPKEGSASDVSPRNCWCCCWAWLASEPAPAPPTPWPPSPSTTSVLLLAGLHTRAHRHTWTGLAGKTLAHIVTSRHPGPHDLVYLTHTHNPCHIVTYD